MSHTESMNMTMHLRLYHTEDKNLEKREELYLKEGREYYSGNLLIPDDLIKINL